jgi:acetyl esterase
MPVDPQCQQFIDQAAAAGVDWTAMEPAAARAAQAQAPRPPVTAQVAKIDDRTIPGPDGEIPVRIYTPEGEGDFPCLVFYHGGGFVLCDLDSHDGICRTLANGAGCVVVSVDYRLAPEHKYPAAAEDCYAALCWTAENGASTGVDTNRIAIGGDSAGGNLTAVVALMARDRAGPAARFQLLVYPVIDVACDTISYEENGRDYYLSDEMMKWFWDQYLEAGADRKDPYHSPIHADDLSGLPPALVITAEYDPLRDEGEAYAAALRKAGVEATATRCDGMIHGFFSMAEIKAGDPVRADACAALRAALA